MPALSYRQPGLAFSDSTNLSDRQIRDFQRDLRQLGYLRSGVDGRFGGGTKLAVKALQHDLLHNDGRGRGSDGRAPLSMLDRNRGRVVLVDGVVRQPMVEVISDLLDDPRYPKLPFSSDPFRANRRVFEQIARLRSEEAPVPFLLAILKQESNLKHFCEPRLHDEDCFVTLGLDTNASEKHIITSRGYGAGQYTLFHHPPRPDEVRDFILDPVRNVQKAVKELRHKFDGYVTGPTSGTTADDRVTEVGDGPLRLCKYTSLDSRYLRDCRRCAINAGFTRIEDGVTPLYPGSGHSYVPTQYYRSADYEAVPIRNGFGCDWPYAMRRYNGAGINSYHYQARVLRHLVQIEGI